MQFNESPKTFTVGTGGVTINRLVKLSAGTVVHNTATSTDNPIGVTQRTASAGDEVAVKLVNHKGTVEIEAAGAITSGAVVYAAAAGRIQSGAGVHATLRQIGLALEAASAAGSVIEVLPYCFCETETFTTTTTTTTEAATTTSTTTTAFNPEPI